MSSVSSNSENSVKRVSRRSTRHRVHEEEPPALLHENRSPAWKMALLAAITMLAFFLGSGRGVWSFGLVCCLVGVGIVCAPPLFKLPKIVTLCLLAITVVPLVGLLPASWFGGVETWRSTLVDSWGIALADTVSPDPRMSFQSWLVTAVGVVWLWTCFGQRASDEGRRLCIYILAAGGAALAGVSLMEYYGTPIPWWPQEGLTGTFGPFANRNHASSLAAITTILCAASALDAYRRHSPVKWLFGLLIWLPLGSIFVNTSRGGLLILFMGAIAWLALAAMRKGLSRKIAVGVAVVLVAVSVAFVSSGQLGSRLRGLADEDKSSLLTSSFRVDLARDTLARFVERPWMGHGANTFAAVFPLVSNLELAELRSLHPESDLLLVMFEGGLLMVVPCIILLGWAMRSAFYRSRRDERSRSEDRSIRRLRLAAGICAGMALMHSIFDVPNHVFAYGLHTALLLGLAVQPCHLKSVIGVLPRMLSRGVGLAAVGVGVLWLGVSYQWWTPDLPITVPTLRKQVEQEYVQGRYREALGLLDRAVWLSPLNFRLYYQRAQLLLLLRQNPDRALLDFGRARALEPNYAANCYEEGLLWLNYAPEFAIIPWRECLNRYPMGSERKVEIYGSMLWTSSAYPALRAELWPLAEGTDMQTRFLLNTTTREEWEDYLKKYLVLHPRLEDLQPQQLRMLFSGWQRLGDVDTLVDLLDGSPRLLPFGWRTVAAEMAKKGRYSEAVLLAVKYLKRQGRPSGDPSKIPQLERAFLFNPTDPRPGVELYFAQRASGDLKSAKSTAEKVLALSEAPAYMKIELASLYLELDDPRRAWEIMEQAMQVIPDA
jgi:O-antigen ligase/tetratricopeptide (TPR) repeat protein